LKSTGFVIAEGSELEARNKVIPTHTFLSNMVTLLVKATCVI